MNKTISCFLLGSFLAVTGQPAFSADDVIVPFRHAKGQILFDKYCSSCHGAAMTGSDKGPPLLHPYYKPSHHGDSSFFRAGLKGVRAHHWNFGDMPPVEGMTESKMKSIVPYIRFYQQNKKLYQVGVEK